MHQRMGQRGINERLVEITSQYGTDHGDRIVLSRKNAEELLAGLDALRKDLIKIQEKGGIVVVESGETQVTVYRVDSFDRKKKKATYAKH
ncbi:hypothetical protein [uncultured Halomonas sp.]|uniref:hypothetical protein n=1 Tax=uncultured Halomonas sp. TaxID=173971 RepID=UPI002617B4E4|nr:hypothetical protein [uncultured Halomonas sp.]